MFPSSLKYHTIWLSDIHLGDRHCKSALLLYFLSRVQCKTLYLVGDVLDLWSLSRQWYWPAEHSKVLRKLLEIADCGTRVIYVPGNHDELLREFAGRAFGRIRIEPQSAHMMLDGRRLLVTHGDEFEYGFHCGALTQLLGSASYSVLLALNRFYNRLRAARGLPYWSLATALKNRVGNARKAITAFEETAAEYARLHGFDGVVCGHIHQPRIRTIGGIVYCNDGDWVDNCTALAEHLDGSLALLHLADLHVELEATATTRKSATALATDRVIAFRRKEFPHVHG